MSNIEQIFKFLKQVSALKSEMRFKTVKGMHGDTVASHVWRLSLMSLLVIKELKLDLDEVKVLKMIITHDLAEVITGDYDAKVMANGIMSQKDKDNIEERAIESLEKILPSDLGEEILSLWHEYQAKKTSEACFASALDKIEGSLTVVDAGSKKIDVPDLTAVYANKAMRLYPKIEPVWKQLKNELKELFFKAGIPWKKEYDDYSSPKK